MDVAYPQQHACDTPTGRPTSKKDPSGMLLQYTSHRPMCLQNKTWQVSIIQGRFSRWVQHLTWPDLTWPASSAGSIGPTTSGKVLWKCGLPPAALPFPCVLTIMSCQNTADILLLAWVVYLVDYTFIVRQTRLHKGNDRNPAWHSKLG